MTAPTLEAPARHVYGLSAGFGMEPKKYRKDNGVFKMEGVAVFRSGTFRDMYGEQMTWDSMHITAMVNHYNMLKNANLFADVPVRDGHGGFILSNLPGNGRVIGYHTQMTTAKLKAPHDDQEYDYLLADYEIIDPQAAWNVEHGLWRNRSAEIIRYRTNAEAEYWPVYGGVAYVDIPAVEGLKFSQSNGSAGAARTHYFVYMDKELSVNGQIPTQTSGATLPFQVGLPTAHAFSVNGQPVTDYAAVQAHITTLEAFRTEVTDTNRANFVNGLAAANRIPVTEVEKTLAFAKSLTGEQFAAWQETFTPAQQPAPALGQIGNAVTNMAAVPAQVAAHAAAGQNADIETAKGVVKNMRAAGLPKAQIEAGKHYAMLKAAGQAPAL